MSSEVALADSRMMGMARNASSALSSRMTFMPSSLGIMMSRTMMAGRSARTAAKASTPSAAVITSKPSDSNVSCNIRRTTGSSSTIRTLASGTPTTLPASRSRTGEDHGNSEEEEDDGHGEKPRLELSDPPGDADGRGGQEARDGDGHVSLPGSHHPPQARSLV